MGGFDGVAAPEDSRALERLIRQDQLAGVRRNVRAAVLVNEVIALAILGVALHYGQIRAGSLWFAAATVMNATRFAQAWLPGKEGERQFWPFLATALLSGGVWAFLPALCDFYAGPQAIFYLTVVCGITAGAITHGTPYAPMPTCFILPPLASIILCMVYQGSFDHMALAFTVLVYSAALVRFAFAGEKSFRETSRLKNQAVTLAQSLSEAHGNALGVAREMAHRASHDLLTGLLNRAGFMQEAGARLESDRAPFCLMLLDLDGFKSVNDVFGHHAGDRVLVEVARRLEQALSEDFTMARLGGDEFAIFYDSSIVDAFFPAELATRLVTAIEVPFASFDIGRLGACVGVYVGRGRNVTEMLTCADEALYAAKSAGRNRHYVFDEALLERLDMRRDVERDLLRALDEGELALWYQPIFHRETRAPAGLEALLRWKHKRHGLIPPEEVILAAALAGLAEPLLRYIFGQVCGMIAELRSRGMGELRVAMNISPREISRLPVDEMIIAGLAEARLPAGALEIEITEETALDIRSVQEKLRRLKEHGVSIAIDDFGVGYSSMATLRQGYISKVKIDYSFVRGISGSPENQILVQAILNLGRSLGVAVVAEGVETAADLDWLDKAGGELAQGYYLRQPGTKAAVLEWLAGLKLAS